MNFKKSFGFLLCGFSVFALPFTLSVHAYEVDNFTDREKITRDALEVMNLKVNKILSTAAKEVVKGDPGACNKAKLRQEVLRWIRPDPTGQIEVWLELTKQVDRTKVGLRKSIYQDVGFFTAPILNVVGIGRSIRLAGQIVGSDKIGHFFMQGLEFYDLVQGGKPIEKVLQENNGEDGVWGLATSGVYSYADIAADYQGYRFWSELTTGEYPYFKCEEKKGWVQNRQFSWANYVNPAWDEAINCSGMKPKIQAKVDAYLQNHGMKCPMVPTACDEVVKLDHSEFFTSPKCKSAVTASSSKDPEVASF